MQTSILEWLEASAKRYPNKSAFTDDKNEISFAQTMFGAKAIGSCLSEMVEPGNPVAVLTGRHAFTPVCFFGVLYSGCHYVPLDPESPAERLNAILSRLSKKVILTDNAHLPLVNAIHFTGKVILMEDALQTQITETQLQYIRTQVTDLDPLYVIFTSGSTGIPKGVVTSHRAMCNFITGLTDVLEIDHTEVIGSQAPLDYVGAVKDIYTGLLTGACVVIIPKTYFTVSENLFHFLNEHKVTSIAWTVTALVLPTTQGIFDDSIPPKYLKRVGFTGSVMPCKYLRVWQQNLPGVRFINLYGPTEVTACCSYYVVDGLVNHDDTLPIGVPFKNYNMFILKEDNTKAKPGEMGELCVGGISIGLGYYDDAELSSQIFIQNPLHNLYRDMIYRTGDLSIQRPDGVFEYHGRRDRQIKLHGYRIELGEIEESLKALDVVDDGCCLYDAENERLFLYYSGIASVKEIAVALRRSLPAHMIPRKIIRLETLPLMANMKVDIQKLKKMMTEGSCDKRQEK